MNVISIGFIHRKTFHIILNLSPVFVVVCFPECYVSLRYSTLPITVI